MLGSGTGGTIFELKKGDHSVNPQPLVSTKEPSIAFVVGADKCVFVAYVLLGYWHRTSTAAIGRLHAQHFETTLLAKRTLHVSDVSWLSAKISGETQSTNLTHEASAHKEVMRL